MTKIYTKTGDKGTTGTFFGRMGKSDQLAEALGSVDELNSWIGLARKFTIHDLRFENFDKELKNIQTNLLIIGSGLSGSGQKINSYETRRLEKFIDKMTAELPKLSNFIYPVGELQVARAVARRCEREVVAALQIRNIKSTDTKRMTKYLNRLSDALFMMGRWVNRKMEMKEEVWVGKM